MKSIRFYSIPALLLLLTLGSVSMSAVRLTSAAPATVAGKVQLVQSVPLETDLAVAEIPHAYTEWVSYIRAAKQSIDIEQMYLWNGTPSDPGNEGGSRLEPVLQELEAAAVRGVKIRFILSKNMLNNDPDTLTRLKKIKGLELRNLDLSRRGNGIQHAKFFIFDSQSVFVGSQNFDSRSITHIHELGVRVEDAGVTSRLQAVFDTDWTLCLGPTEPVPTTVRKFPDLAPGIEFLAGPAQLNPPGIGASIDGLLALLHSAKKRIRLQVMDFSILKYGSSEIWSALDLAFRDAAARGVKIDFLVSNWNTDSSEIGEIKSLGKVPGIDLRIVTIPEYSGGFIPYARVAHSKYMIVDDEKLWIGTSNFEWSYFYNTRGVELIFSDTQLTRQANEVFDKLWTAPYTEAIQQDRVYPTPRKG